MQSCEKVTRPKGAWILFLDDSGAFCGRPKGAPRRARRIKKKTTFRLRRIFRLLLGGVYRGGWRRPVALAFGAPPAPKRLKNGHHARPLFSGCFENDANKNFSKKRRIFEFKELNRIRGPGAVPPGGVPGGGSISSCYRPLQVFKTPPGPAGPSKFSS